jgi:hypothetical protein
MAYEIRNYDGTVFIELGDGILDSNSTSLTLIGKNSSNFGDAQNENFLHLLQNFAGATPPSNPLRGQLYYDTDDYRIKVYTGGDWLSTAISDFSGTKPTTGRYGYLWFNSVEKQFFVHDGSDYILIGPERTSGFGETKLVSTSTFDLFDTLHPVIKLTIDDEVLGVISSSDFDVNSSNEINGIPHVYRGITLKNHQTGDVEIHGRSTFANLSTTATNLAGGVLGSLPYQTSAGLTDFLPITLTVGSVLVSDGSSIRWSVPNEVLIGRATTATHISAGATGSIPYQSNVGRTTFLPYEGNGKVLVSGNNGPQWKSETEFGAGTALTATRATSLLSSVGIDQFVSASTATGAQTIVERSSNGNIYGADFVGNIFYGTATAAQYADLAEKYLSDVEYEVGTVVVVGGEKEVTASSWGKRALGVVSANPAYMMNKDLEGGTYIALKGRVPVKVIGAIKKGDNLIAANGGNAVAAVYHSSEVFAISLESSNDTGVKLIEAVVL